MTRVLEFVVALIMVFILAVIVGLFLPSHAHIERSIQISHDPQHIYDVLNNFRRFQQSTGAGFKALDPSAKFSLSGPAYGTGATVSWTGNGAIGNGKLVNKSSKIELNNDSTVTWDLTNNWHGHDKTFTFTVTPDESQRVSTVTWSYDVDYGWNLISRYSQIWIHGDPSTVMQVGLDSLQSMLAGIANVDYSKVNPGLYRTNAKPVLLVSTKAERTVQNIDDAKTTAMQQLQAALTKLGVKQAGPTTTVRTEWGDTTFIFNQVVPIGTTTLTVDGQTHDLTKLPPPPTGGQSAEPPASASSAASASSVASAASAGAPASASSSGAPAPGSLTKQNELVINANVRAKMMPAREVLAATWTGETGIQFMVKALEAYAGTHGYNFDESAAPAYDELVSLPTVSDDDKLYRVFLPVTDAPAETPDQISGRAKPFQPLDASLWATSAKPAETRKAEAGKKHEEKKKPEARKRHEPARKSHRR